MVLWRGVDTTGSCVWLICRGCGRYSQFASTRGLQALSGLTHFFGGRASYAV